MSGAKNKSPPFTAKMKFLLVFFLVFATFAHGIYTDVKTGVTLGGFTHGRGINYNEVLIENILTGGNFNTDIICLSVVGFDACLGDKTGLAVRTFNDAITEGDLIAKLQLLGGVGGRVGPVIIRGTTNNESHRLVVHTNQAVIGKIRGILGRFTGAVAKIARKSPLVAGVQEATKVCVNGGNVKCIEAVAQQVTIALRTALNAINEVVDVELQRTLEGAGTVGQVSG